MYNKLGKVLLSTGECDIELNKVKIEHEPYVWRSSKLPEGNWISFEQWKQKYQSDAKIFELIRSAIKDGRVKRWSGPTNDKADKMQLEIDRLKGELAKTKNDLVAAKISLSKKKR